MSEWRELPKGDIVALAEAVKAENEIELFTGTAWIPWAGASWNSTWLFHARSKPKTRQVQLRGFITTYGQLTFYAEGSINYDSALKVKYIRVPSEDRIVEVEE